MHIAQLKKINGVSHTIQLRNKTMFFNPNLLISIVILFSNQLSAYEQQMD